MGNIIFLLKVLIEGMGLGMILIIICAFNIRNGAVGMVHLYHKDVQDRCIEMGITTSGQIKKRAMILKGCGFPVYVVYLLVMVYLVNGARGFWEGFWQCLVILLILNLMDRLLIDEFWVGHTKAWTIPGTEDLKPYIDKKDKIIKWSFGTIGFVLIAAIMAGIMAVILK